MISELYPLLWDHVTSILLVCCISTELEINYYYYYVYFWTFPKNALTLFYA